MVRYSNPYKPVGWRHESHRHYLASKGISTSRYYAKGNRSSSLLASLHAQSLTNSQIAGNPGIPVEVRQEAYSRLNRPRSIPLIQAPAPGISQEFESVNPAFGGENIAFQPLPAADVPSIQSVPDIQELNTPELSDSRELELIKADDAADAANDAISIANRNSELVPGNVVMTPGVPEIAPYGFDTI